jgi:hypothetical protein
MHWGFSGPRTRTPFSLRWTLSPRNHLLCEVPLFMQPESPGLSTTRCKMHQDTHSLFPSTTHTSRPVSPRAFDPAKYPAGFCSLFPSGSLAMRDAACQSGMYLEKGKSSMSRRTCQAVYGMPEAPEITTGPRRPGLSRHGIDNMGLNRC